MPDEKIKKVVSILSFIFFDKFIEDSKEYCNYNLKISIRGNRKTETTLTNQQQNV